MFTHRLKLLPVVLLLAGCTPKHTRDADTLARAGDWESALTQYRLASQERPDDFPLQRKVEMAEKKVAAIWTKRGWEANGEGHLGVAATLWTKAIELTPERERATCDALEAIEKNASALEYFGDSAVAEERHEDAVGVFGAILKAQPERVDVVTKHMDAKRAFATQLFQRADVLARRDLPGAALVTDLRALQHDPMQPNAFQAGTQLKKEMKSRARIALQDVKIVDQGYKSLSVALSSTLTPRLDKFAPYGPTKDPGGVRASFKATIEEFTKNETSENGFDELPNMLPPPTEPIANPAIPEQKAKIDELEQKLAGLKKEIQRAIAEKARQRKAGRAVDDPGLVLARQADATRVELDDAKKVLAALPAKVAPPLPPATWQLAWTKTIRVTEARIRFELQETDYAEPIVVTITHRVTKEDRTHDGHPKQGVEADPLKLPTWDSMVGELAAQFSDGTEAIAKARERRIGDLVARGREQLQKGNDAEALDAFVTVLFMMGPTALPEDAASFVARSLEHDRFKDLVAIQ